MKNCLTKLLLSLVLFSVWTGAHAQADPGDWYWSAMMSYIDDDQDRAVDDGLYGTHIGIGKAISNFNVEAYFAHAAPSGPNRQTQLSGGVDFQLLIGRENKITPYVLPASATCRSTRRLLPPTRVRPTRAASACSPTSSVHPTLPCAWNIAIVRTRCSATHCRTRW